MKRLKLSADETPVAPGPGNTWKQLCNIEHPAAFAVVGERLCSPTFLFETFKLTLSRLRQWESTGSRSAEASTATPTSTVWHVKNITLYELTPASGVITDVSEKAYSDLSRAYVVAVAISASPQASTAKLVRTSVLQQTPIRYIHVHTD